MQTQFIVNGTRNEKDQKDWKNEKTFQMSIFSWHTFLLLCDGIENAMLKSRRII